MLSETRPPGDMAVKEVLTALHAGRPKVTPGRKDFKPLHALRQVSELIAHALRPRLRLAMHEGDISPSYPLNRLRPSLARSVRLRPGIGAVVDGLSGRPPSNVARQI